MTGRFAQVRLFDDVGAYPTQAAGSACSPPGEEVYDIAAVIRSRRMAALGGLLDNRCLVPLFARAKLAHRLFRPFGKRIDRRAPSTGKDGLLVTRHHVLLLIWNPLHNVEATRMFLTKMCRHLEQAAFGRHRERRSRVAIQPILAAAAGLTARLLRSTRNDALELRSV